METLEHDALTGLYRREKLNKYIESDIIKKSTTVIFFDVNGLKAVNDSLGYDLSDVLIQKAAYSISVFRTDKSEVFRIGGDEF